MNVIGLVIESVSKQHPLVPEENDRTRCRSTSEAGKKKEPALPRRVGGDHIRKTLAERRANERASDNNERDGAQTFVAPSLAARRSKQVSRSSNYSEIEL